MVAKVGIHMPCRRWMAIACILLARGAGASADAFSPPRPETIDLNSPNYCITGFGASAFGGHTPLLTDTNNQIRFKIDVHFKLVGNRSDKSGIYFGYAQNSFWNYFEPSSPFLDNNYMPEFFLYLDALREGRPYKWFIPSMKFAVNHESNGMTEGRDRSADRVAATAEFGAFVRTAFSGSISLWAYLRTGENNKDIADHAGMGYIRINWRHTTPGETVKLGASVVTHFVYTSRILSNIEADLFFNPFYRLNRDFAWQPAFMLQYFHGTGENMLYYNKWSNNLRFGMAFVK